ncbi:MAG TPA: hypothetical protein VE338_01805 [Ktedonobacterales bacterium]|jgi:hypothetical protein|nr:hypothetical protein [Ktedonobacterales bacterium]
MFVDESLFIVRGIWSLAFPCHESLGKFSAINRLTFISVRWALRSSLRDEEPGWVSGFKCPHEAQHDAIITAKVAQLTDLVTGK